MNLKKQEKNKIREKILTEKYGRFLLLEEILKEEEIVSLPPRVLLARMCDILSIDETLISRHAFYSWCIRYKKAHRAKRDEIEQIAPTTEKSSGKTKKEKEFDDWLGWQPSEEALKGAGSLPLYIKPIIKKI